MIECKTGIKGLKKSGIQTFNEYVYKLAALRKFFGLSVKLILIMLQPLTHNRSFFDDRTSVLNILLLGGQEWANPDDLIEQILK